MKLSKITREIKMREMKKCKREMESKERVILLSIILFQPLIHAVTPQNPGVTGTGYERTHIP